MSAESMNIASAIIKKHLPEMQAAMEKAVADSVKDESATGGSGDAPK